MSFQMSLGRKYITVNAFEKRYSLEKKRIPSKKDVRIPKEAHALKKQRIHSKTA